MSAEEFLNLSKTKLDEINAGADASTASIRKKNIEELSSDFEAFYSSVTKTLDAFYSNFDVGSKDYKMYDERYNKFKMDCEMHRGAIRRRIDEQNKCCKFVSDCEKHSAELMNILDKMRSDDWSDENRNIQTTEEQFQVFKQLNKN
jgi:hypothetical protein